MAYTRVAAVTGANKGIGLAIVRNLALQYPSSTFNNGPLLIYLTARNAERGQAALQTLQNDEQLRKAKALSQDGGLADIKYQTLDISSSDSIRDFAAFVAREHPDGLDILVNNAGIAMEGFDGNVVEQTLRCNYHGTLEMTETFLPLIRQGGRLVNVSSTSGSLGKYPEQLQNAFRGAKSVGEVTNLMDRFAKGVRAGTHTQDGWPSAAYAVSKAGVTGFTRVIGQGRDAKAKSVLVNAVCPGYVNTDMTKGRGFKSIDQGARTPVLLALGDIGGVTGEYWREDKVREW